LAPFAVDYVRYIRISLPQARQLLRFVGDSQPLFSFCVNPQKEMNCRRRSAARRAARCALKVHRNVALPFPAFTNPEKCD